MQKTDFASSTPQIWSFTLYFCEEIALTSHLVSMDLVEVSPGLDPPLCDKFHGNNDLNHTTPTVGLGIDLILSALGRTIMKKNSIVD